MYIMAITPPLCPPLPRSALQRALYMDLTFPLSKHLSDEVKDLITGMLCKGKIPRSYSAVAVCLPRGRKTELSAARLPQRR